MTPSSFHDVPMLEDLRQREVAAVEELRARRAAIANEQAARRRVYEKAEAAVPKEAPGLAKDLAADFKRRWDLAIERAALGVARRQVMFRHTGEVPPGGSCDQVRWADVEFELGKSDVSQPRGRGR